MQAWLVNRLLATTRWIEREREKNNKDDDEPPRCDMTPEIERDDKM